MRFHVDHVHESGNKHCCRAALEAARPCMLPCRPAITKAALLRVLCPSTSPQGAAPQAPWRGSCALPLGASAPPALNQRARRHDAARNARARARRLRSAQPCRDPPIRWAGGGGGAGAPIRGYHLIHPSFQCCIVLASFSCGGHEPAARAGPGGNTMMGAVAAPAFDDDTVR